MSKANGKKTAKKQPREGIAEISAAGYKSIVDKQQIEIRPLTILAGANSSGKSSIVQPLLLLKQTLEAPYDPGALLLDGPNVRFTSASQFLSRTTPRRPVDRFSVGLRIGKDAGILDRFLWLPGKGLEIEETDYRLGDWEGKLVPDMSPDDVKSAIPRSTLEMLEPILKVLEKTSKWTVTRRRCFLEASLAAEGSVVGFSQSVIKSVEQCITEVIHLPGLRGNPARTYPVGAVGDRFPGTFERYAASVIAHWQSTKNDDKLSQLSTELESLGLTWKVLAEPVTDTEVELRVGRLPHRIVGGARDLVSIADVGLGLSQTLPVLVALLVAKPGQLVYLEQPEIHLHPRAQWKLAEILVDAANQGVRVLVETHSSLLLLGIQALVAEGKKLDPRLVKLHWFERGPEGFTIISGADLDETGAFGEWPEDFADVSLQAESRYLDAAESRLEVGE